VEPLVSRADRTRTLEAEVDYFVQRGWRLRSKNPADAELVKGQPVSHALHIFFSIATLGLWLLVYVPLLIFGGEKHKYIAVDERGRVSMRDGQRSDG
jgi:hypothetical protein